MRENPQTLAGLVLSQRHQHNNPIIWKFITAVGGLFDSEEESYGQQRKDNQQIFLVYGEQGFVMRLGSGKIDRKMVKD
ncbi:MAG: hypothetical protein IPG86_12580 [Chitinophagaceae bacterium]|nr:hypothetical protein [Chitinophagaceae bacterium]